MSQSESSSIQPKSIRQKRILDIAANNPGATLAEIAEQVPSVSADHVDRVLDQYGDPADDDNETTDSPSVTHSDEDASSESASTSEGTNDDSTIQDQQETPENTSSMEVDTHTEATQSGEDGEADSANVSEPTPGAETGEISSEPADETVPDPDDLTQKERETLRAIAYEPSATQKQIAKMLSVSRATVSNRVNAISGFDWADRDTFVDEVFDEKVTVDSSIGAAADAGPKTAMDGAHDEGKQPVADGAPTKVGGDTPAVPNPRGKVDGGTGERDADDDGGNVDSNQASPPDDESVADTEAGPAREPLTRNLEEFSERLASLEEKVEDANATESDAPFDDPELLHKVVYACMNSERVSEDEEFKIIQELMN